MANRNFPRGPPLGEGETPGLLEVADVRGSADSCRAEGGGGPEACPACSGSVPLQARVLLSCDCWGWGLGTICLCHPSSILCLAARGSQLIIPT